ncbi:hypothetical protein PHAVU_008G121500 [Phaseolus vulgaris]|uniref:Knottin scorpion toxin-like domain-containing protein n=1 Tax=Phaseolus vulgaris TaxID=3885 RepID=V7B4N4_PHAVU|nr:hypothetical protein PHAVU_008G121500g [Phaseolus vulgaris]ESW12540.1 hypothetical protein PHAVU_008G121500g [Phaseolus vulgaris]
MVSRFCHPFLFSVLFVALVLTSGGEGAVAEPVTGMIDEDLRCFGLCTGNCKEDCASKGFKSGFCVQQGSLNQCCCL